jgi:uroporphyrinogen decarboxylase
MGHRERVLAALSHQPPDRVPIDFGATRDSSIVVEGYERLAARFDVPAEANLISRMMRVVDIDERILQALDVDLRGVFPAAPPDVLGERTYRDEWGVERVNPPGSHYYDQRTFPLSGEITLAQLARYPWPNATDPIRKKGLKERVHALRASTDCAIVLNLPSGFVHSSQYLRGFEDWFADLASDHKLAGALFDAVLEVSLGMCRNILEEVGDEVDVLMASDDLGLQNSLMLSPALYRELIKPRHRRYFQLLHDMSPGKLFFHTCGAVGDIIEDLIEIGVDVLHPVQVTATGMDPATLKKRYGKRLAFWGAVDTQFVLPRGSTAEVCAEVERIIEALGDEGGFILGAVHNLQPDVPTDNILAMFRHAAEYRPSYGRG